MNKAILMGRLTRDPELTTAGSAGIPCAKFTLAVDRRFKNAQGERETDFIPCVAWRQTAEFIEKYFRQGSKVAVVGSIQVRSWEDKNSGERRYMTEVIVDESYFAESKKESGGYDGSNAGGSYGRGSSTINSGRGSVSSEERAVRQSEEDYGLPFSL